MLRAVLDANVYVSAVLRPEGPPGRIIDRFLREEAFDLVVAPTIVEETRRVFSYPKLRKLIRGNFDPELWLEDVVLLAEIVSGDYEITGVCPDPDDDKYLGVAVEGRAAFVVTGDQGFLSVEKYRDVRIVSPRAFLELLGD
ncbi:MAG: putative toxin-antitoxin system toxin component, PIN family [Gemmatimonas sp.]|nr:putative toxin-antitoxin system toxin component, PIN family [Gemmatimonas sp.]